MGLITGWSVGELHWLVGDSAIVWGCELAWCFATSSWKSDAGYVSKGCCKPAQGCCHAGGILRLQDRRADSIAIFSIVRTVGLSRCPWDRRGSCPSCSSRTRASTNHSAWVVDTVIGDIEQLQASVGPGKPGPAPGPGWQIRSSFTKSSCVKNTMLQYATYQYISVISIYHSGMIEIQMPLIISRFHRSKLLTLFDQRGKEEERARRTKKVKERQKQHWIENQTK